jgi:phosphatidate phosphatase APP1
VLVGDSGEKDPEVYGQIAREHPAQILRIYIRDVTGDRADDARYRGAFRGIPAEKWQLFRDPVEVRDFRPGG